jgi:phage major head subunit gpT-like protein
MLRFGVQPLVNEFLSSATKYYFQDNTKNHKAMTWQQREAPVYSQRTNESDPLVFDTHRFGWGVWGRGAPAWSYAFLMLRSGS